MVPFWQVKNVGDDAVEGKIGKIYIPDQKVSGKFIHLAVLLHQLSDTQLVQK